MLPHGVLRPFRWALVPALVPPRMSCMLDNLRNRKFIAIPLPPLMLPTAAIWRR